MNITINLNYIIFFILVTLDNPDGVDLIDAIIKALIG
jgi:hypothetical protein